MSAENGIRLCPKCGFKAVEDQFYKTDGECPKCGHAHPKLAEVFGKTAQRVGVQ